jgi:hypothetical protein
MKTLYNYAKLNGKITEVCGSQAEFAKRVGLSQHSVSAKLTNKVNFKQDEIEDSIRVLGIDRDSITAYFFDDNVQGS